MTPPASWADVPTGTPGLASLPYGVATVAGDNRPRTMVAIGAHAVDLAELASAGLLDGTSAHPLDDHTTGTLDRHLAAGPTAWGALRQRLTELLSDTTARDRVTPALVPIGSLTPRLAWTVGDYVDFYSSLDHATNLGRLFRPDSDPLLPNWRHLPVGYHGRAGTVVVSGTDVIRPCGQRKSPDETSPSYGPSRRLDVEVELGCVVGVPTALGSTVRPDDVAEHVFGVVVVNDWSARDIQAWEYQPLGPFLGKSFATSVSAWVLPLAALEGARVPGPVQEPAPLDYLRGDEQWGLDVELELDLNGTVVSRPPFAGLYWTVAQQLAHMTANGASLRTGDLFASGTVSGPEPAQRGSLIELSWGGREPLMLAEGARTFLEDGDVVTMRATAPGVTEERVVLGDVTGRILPAQAH